MVFGAVQRGDSNTSNQSAYFIGFDSGSGNEIWTDTFEYDDGAIINQINGGCFDSNGDLIVVGNTYSGQPIPNLGYLRKYQLPPTGVDVFESQPKSFSLAQNYPNPFNPSTVISFTIAKASDVTLKVYNTLGQEVANLIEGKMTAGEHRINFNASHLPSGAYCYRLTVGTFVSTNRMVLLK